MNEYLNQCLNCGTIFEVFVSYENEDYDDFTFCQKKCQEKYVKTELENDKE